MIETPLRPRRDGWTTERQAAFITALGAGGSIAAAAASVGMSRQTAYRLRRRSAAVAAAWRAAEPALDEAAFDAALDAGLAARFAATGAATSDAALLRALRGDVRRAKRRAAAAARDERVFAEETGRFVTLCNRPAGDPSAPRGANGRFTPQKPVVV